MKGVEAVIYKDFCSELLARELAADILALATDVAAIYADWNTRKARALRHTDPDTLRQYSFPQALWDRGSRPPAASLSIPEGPR